MSKILINGLPQSDISVLDRAFQYGDGLFETIAVINGKCLLWDFHMARLQQSAQRLFLPLPALSLLFDEACQLTAQMTTKKAILKIMITRGVGGRGYSAPQQVNSNRILSLYPYPDYSKSWQNGIKTQISPIRLGLNPLLAGMKHLNRLEQVLARSNWQQLEIAEKIMLDINQQVIEGTQSNLFIYANQKLYTPLLNNAGVEGVMKKYIIQAAQNLGIICHQKPLLINDLIQADGLFFSNSVIGYWAVKQLEDTHYVIEKLPQNLLQKVTQLFQPS